MYGFGVYKSLAFKNSKRLYFYSKLCYLVEIDTFFNMHCSK